MSKTIGELQAEIEAALSRVHSCSLPPELQALKLLVPPGTLPRVSLLYPRQDCKRGYRRIRRNADWTYWTPENCVAEVSYEMEPADAVERPDSQSPLDDFLTALCDAEREPRFREFVGIKPFRDHYLTGRGYDWAESAQARHQVLSQAINEGWVLTGKVPNPKSPENPTTTIRLNRHHQVVVEALKRTHQERSPFRPVPIRGESLSATILAERR